MSNIHLNSPTNGGGAATSIGILFQQKIGAYFAAKILSGDQLNTFGLGNAFPVLLRFETEAPVDDILVATSTNGFIAVQAKTTVSLSAAESSPFYCTVEQFVRHWHQCQNGNGSLDWNRPLNPDQDRLVLAVGDGAPHTIRCDFPGSLQLFSQSSSRVMNQKQQNAFRIFNDCVSAAWHKITSASLPSHLIEELCRLIVVKTFDFDSIDSTLASLLTPCLAKDTDTTAALSVLSEICCEMMSKRGGGDLRLLRNKLMQKGIRLASPPNYRNDIERLRQHSVEIATYLKRYENIEDGSGQPITLHRECQNAVEQAVQSGSLLIIGEPGAGKSAVLNALACNLRQKGDDVLQLAVDHYSVISLEGLRHELGLEHSLIDILKAWDGPSHGWLIIDALDATRGGKSEAAFCVLIEQVLALGDRWRVIASIRSFDLSLGVKFRNLFKSHPSEMKLDDTLFSSVRYINIPHWSDNEFSDLLSLSPVLANALNGASAKLLDLAKVPFNTRLIAELVSQDADVNLIDISSQSGLLKLYWQQRINTHGLQATKCLKTLVKAMVAARSLSVSLLLENTDPERIDTLCREGVLVRTKNDRFVQFRHHLLFDYTAAQTLFDPAELIAGKHPFPKQQALGLVLSPALGFLLQEIWSYDENHAQFWQTICHILNDKDGDPIIRSTAGRIAAEYPVAQNDLHWFAERVKIDDKSAITALNHIYDALVIRFEDEKEIELRPWIYLVSDLTAEIEKVAEILRLLLHPLIRRVTDSSLCQILGTASRAILSYGLTLNEPEYFVKSAIPFVADTIDTDIEASCHLLEQVIDLKRFQHFGPEEISILCYHIQKIGDYAPDLVVKIFAFVYQNNVTEIQPTNLRNSQTLPMISNTSQDYESARYSLGEYFSRFLEQNPTQAIDAAVIALDGYVTRQHQMNTAVSHISVVGYDTHLRADLSHIWAHNPDNEYANDGEILVKQLLQRLRTASESDALILAKLICKKASLAIFWARLFLAANERDDHSLIDFLWPIASQEIFIKEADTRKDAIDLIAKGIVRRSEMERKEFENSAFQYNVSDYIHPEDSKNRLLYRLFHTIGQENLLTVAARHFLKNSTASVEILNNDRIFKISTTVSDQTPYDYIDGLDKNEANNAVVIRTVENAKATLGLAANSTFNHQLSLESVFKILETVYPQFELENIHPYVRTMAEDVIVRACAAIVEQKMLPSLDDVAAEQIMQKFLKLLDITAHSSSPKVEENTEKEFERIAGWGSPAPRIDAAQIMLDIIPLRSDLYPRLKPEIERMLIDHHPAVRFQVSIRLLYLWDIDKASVWHFLSERLTLENNTTIIEHMVGYGIRRLLDIDPQRTFCLIQNLLKRFNEDPERQKRIRHIVSKDLTILWCKHEIRTAYQILQCWIADPAMYNNELNRILQTLREGFTHGLTNHATPKDKVIRLRTLDIAYDIINAAGTKLEDYYSRHSLSDTEKEKLKLCAQIVDSICAQLHFACKGNANQTALDHNGLKQFLHETERHLKRIAGCGTPHTIYYLLQLLETLVPINPAICFDIMAHALRNGIKSGFQYETLGMEQLVKMMGVFLADYKTIFEDKDRRSRLIESLDIFMAAGWPAARRLLYRLPELI